MAIHTGSPAGHGAVARWALWRRIGYGATGLIGLVALTTSIALGFRRDGDPPAGSTLTGRLTAGWEHALNQPAYFTFISVVMTTLVSWWLVIRPHSRSPVLHVVRIAAVCCLSITGLVFNILLRDDSVLSPLQQVNDFTSHVVLPILLAVVTLLVGPFGQVRWRRIAISLLIPALWLVFTLVRGPILDWVPYDFLDHTAPGGYTTVATYCAVILTGYLVVATVLWGYDRLRSRRDPEALTAVP